MTCVLPKRTEGRARTPLRAANSQAQPKCRAFRNVRRRAAECAPYLLLALAVSVQLAGAQPGVTPQSGPQTNGHPFACADYSQGKVFIVSRAGEIEWEYQTTSCNDLWVLPSGNLLFNTGHGVKEVTRDKQVVFDYQSKSEIYACQRLTNGNTFIGECNSGRLLEVEPSGRIAKEVRLLPEGKDGGHLYMRNARRLENGHYLVAHYGEQVVREYDAAGKPVLSIPAAGGPHSVARLPNGHTLISCGDLPGGSRVFEVDRAGQDRLAGAGRRPAGHQPEVHGRFPAAAQRQHRHGKLAGPRPVRQGAPSDRSDARQARRLDFRRPPGHAHDCQPATAGRSRRRHTRPALALSLRPGTWGCLLWRASLPRDYTNSRKQSAGCPLPACIHGGAPAGIAGNLHSD